MCVFVCESFVADTLKVKDRLTCLVQPLQASPTVVTVCVSSVAEAHERGKDLQAWFNPYR